MVEINNNKFIIFIIRLQKQDLQLVSSKLVYEQATHILTENTDKPDDQNLTYAKSGIDSDDIRHEAQIVAQLLRNVPLNSSDDTNKIAEHFVKVRKGFSTGMKRKFVSLCYSLFGAEVCQAKGLKSISGGSKKPVAGDQPMSDSDPDDDDIMKQSNNDEIVDDNFNGEVETETLFNSERKRKRNGAENDSDDENFVRIADEEAYKADIVRFDICPFFALIQAQKKNIGEASKPTKLSMNVNNKEFEIWASLASPMQLALQCFNNKITKPNHITCIIGIWSVMHEIMAVVALYFNNYISTLTLLCPNSWETKKYVECFIAYYEVTMNYYNEFI